MSRQFVSRPTITFGVATHSLRSPGVDCVCSCELRCSRAEWILLPCLFPSTKLRDAPFQLCTDRDWKLVIGKMCAQSCCLCLQLWLALFQVSECSLLPCLFWLLNQGVRLDGSACLQTVFEIVNWVVVGLSVFYFLVLTCNLIFCSYDCVVQWFVAFFTYFIFLAIKVTGFTLKIYSVVLIHWKYEINTTSTVCNEL